MRLIITGNPGTGKTYLAKKLAKLLNLKYIDVKSIIEKKKIYDSYDKKMRCYVVPIPKLKSALKPILKQDNIIIDSHLSHYLDPKDIDLCIVKRCPDLKKLKRRLEKRKYSKAKVRENLDCEIFDICLNEAKENKHNIIAVDQLDSKGINALAKKLKKL